MRVILHTCVTCVTYSTENKIYLFNVTHSLFFLNSSVENINVITYVQIIKQQISPSPYDNFHHLWTKMTLTTVTTSTHNITSIYADDHQHGDNDNDCGCDDDVVKMTMTTVAVDIVTVVMYLIIIMSMLMKMFMLIFVKHIKNICL